MKAQIQQDTTFTKTYAEATENSGPQIILAKGTISSLSDKLFYIYIYM